MMSWALAFLSLATVMGLSGFGGLGGETASIAKLLFVVFGALFLLAVTVHLIGGRPSQER